MIKRIFFPLWMLTILCVITAPPQAQAQSAEDMATQHGQVELLPSAPYFEAGKTYRLGVAFTMEPDWHIYWRYGGETGQAPDFFWDLADEFETPQISWPMPEYIEYNTIINYGYHDETVLFADINIPEGYSAKELKIDLDLEWLICKDICVPEFGSYSISLPSKTAYNINSTSFTADPRLAKHMSRIPVPLNGDVDFTAEDFSFTIAAQLENDLFTRVSTLKETGEHLFFAPYDWGWVKSSSDPSVFVNTDTQTVSMRYPRGRRLFDSLDRAAGVLVFAKDGHSLAAYEISGDITKKLSAARAVPTSAPIKEQEAQTMGNVDISPEQHAQSFTFGKAMVFAFIGGLILNLMPCVFPILSLKALALIKHANEPYKVAVMGGIAYSSGVILSFVAIAGLMIALQSGGAQIGWGFQLQDRNVLYVLTLLMFLISLSLLGALNVNKILPSKITNIGQDKTNNEGLSGAFFTGLLATLVAAPCTAPFMAAALGFAATQPPLLSLSIFATLGAGLAFPYFILCTVPALRNMLPKPGAWMESFRQFLAFPMLAATIWLGLALVMQDNYLFLLPLLIALLTAAFAAWVLARHPKNALQKAIKYILLCASILVIIIIPHKFGSVVMGENGEATIEDAVSAHDSKHAAFTQDALKRALMTKPNQPIFVYLTADWCITCKVNERRVLETKDIESLFAEKNVLVFKGDWTKRNSDITEYLSRFERNGVPLYVYYGPADTQNGQRPAPVILPQLLTFNHFESLFDH